ncbi:MAG: hypothetical protein ACXU88_18625 [Myxococcaceae bacterium]
MHSSIPSFSPSWHLRARELLARALHRLADRLTPRPAAGLCWAEMRPIDFEGEDTSLTEADLRHFR